MGIQLKIIIIALISIFSLPIYSYHSCVKWKNQCDKIRSCNFWRQGNYCYICRRVVYELGRPVESVATSCFPNKTNYLRNLGYACNYDGHPTTPQPYCVNWSWKLICKMFCVKTI